MRVGVIVSRVMCACVFTIAHARASTCGQAKRIANDRTHRVVCRIRWAVKRLGGRVSAEKHLAAGYDVGMHMFTWYHREPYLWCGTEIYKSRGVTNSNMSPSKVKQLPSRVLSKNRNIVLRQRSSLGQNGKNFIDLYFYRPREKNCPKPRRVYGWPCTVGWLKSVRVWSVWATQTVQYDNNNDKINNRCTNDVQWTLKRLNTNPLSRIT